MTRPFRSALVVSALLLVPVTGMAQEDGAPRIVEDSMTDDAMVDAPFAEDMAGDDPSFFDLQGPMEEFEPNPPSGQQAVLRGVEKITARVTDMVVTVDEPAAFGTLQIVVRYCYKTPPEETPEVTAFLEVEDHQPGSEGERVFSGWMFASSPAVSALEHAVYDVWVIDCKAFSPVTADPSDKKSP